MREFLEIYRWMWREIDLKYEGSLGFRLVLFADAITADVARSTQLTLARAVRNGGLRVGRAMRSPAVPVAMRGAVATGFCVALFGPFLMLLGSLGGADTHGEITVASAGIVVFHGQQMGTDDFSQIARTRGFRSVDVLIRDDPRAPVRWSVVNELSEALTVAGVNRVTYRDFKISRETRHGPNSLRR